MRLYDHRDPCQRPIPSLELALDNPRRVLRGDPILRNGYAYAVIDNELLSSSCPH